MGATGRRLPATPPAKRIALYLDAPGEASRLREYVNRQGWEIVAEFQAAAGSSGEMGRLLAEAGSDQLKVDLVLVASLAGTFESTAECAKALRQLHRLGIEFRSYAEPFVDTTRYGGGHLAVLAAAFAQLDGKAGDGAGAADADGLLGELAPGLGAPLRQLLDLQIESLSRRKREAEESERRTKMRAPLGQVLTVGLVIAGYAAALAAASSRSPLTAVINGDRIVGAISAGANGSLNSILQIPDPIRAAVFTLFWSGALFIVRSFPLSSRLGAAGFGFAFLVNLIVLAFASALNLWFLGTAGALLGMVVLSYLVYDFCSVVVTIEALSAEDAIRPVMRPGAAGWLDPAIRRIERVFSQVNPAGRPLLTALFVGLPLLSVAGVLAAITWPGLRIGFLALAFPIWAAWGIGVTRPALRLPLWSMLGWTLVFLFFLSSAVDVSLYFLVLALALLLVTTTVAIFRWPVTDAVA